MALLITLLHGCLALTILVQGQDRSVDAVKMIKSVHGISKNWQEDQCIVGNYSCEGLDCATSGDYSSPELISLNISSSILIEKTDPHVSNLASIKSFTGDYPNICISGPCQKKKKRVIIQVIVAVISSMFLLLAITVFRLIDENSNETYGFENRKIDFVRGIPENSITVCRILIEVNSRFNEIINQAFGFDNHYIDSVMDSAKKSITRCKTLVGAILRFMDEIIKEAFGFANHSIGCVTEIPQKSVTGGKSLIGAILRFENHSIDFVIEIPQTTINVGKTLFGSILRFMDEIIKEAFGFENHSIDSVIEISQKTVSVGRTLIGAILRFMDEIIKEAFGFENHSIDSVIEISQKPISVGRTLFGAILRFMDEIIKEAFGFENHSIDSLIEISRKTITRGNSLIGTILRFMDEIIKEAFGFENHSIDILRFVEEINNRVLGFKNLLIKLEIEIQRISITGLIEAIFRFTNEINKKAIGFKNHCIDMVMGIPLNSITGCKILIEAIFKFINEITIEAFGFKKSCIELVTEMPRSSITGCKTLIGTDMAKLTEVGNDDDNQVIISRPRDKSRGKAICEAVILPTKDFCCPFKDCLAVLTKDDGGVIIQSECHNCNRLACSQCEVHSHSGIECAEFQNLNSDQGGREDILIVETSTNFPLFMCEICVESKPKNESFHIKGCLHYYCTECIINYVASKLQENVTSIRCPVLKCEGLLDPEYCRAVLPLELFEKWGKALCESAILGTEKFYCPFKDCSMLLINDGGDRKATNHSPSSRVRPPQWWSFLKQRKRKHNDKKVITQSECPNCNRLFCAQCKVSWHLGFSCAEFEKFNKNIKGREDEMMKQLAKNKNWKRCPKCRFYVERTSGCMYMKCRCGFAFCYNCTAPSTSKSHICSKCKH